MTNYNIGDEIYTYLYLPSDNTLITKIIDKSRVDENALVYYQDINGKYSLVSPFPLYTPGKIIDKREFNKTIFYCIKLDYCISLSGIAFTLLKPRRNYRKDNRAEDPRLVSLIELPNIC